MKQETGHLYKHFDSICMEVEFQGKVGQRLVSLSEVAKVCTLRENSKHCLEILISIQVLLVLVFE